MTTNPRPQPTRALRWLAAMLACCLLWAGPEVGAADADPLGRAHALLAGLDDSAPSERFAQTARDFGGLVDEVRAAGAADATLIAMRKLAADLRKRSLARLQGAEAAAGDDEGALESLYRSQVWEHLSFAMSAFPFWGSWLDLALAERPSQAANRVQLLWRAKRGFRAASMQIYQPSLVYGGWLGVGFVARAEGQDARARQVFESLKKALSFDPNHPVRKLVDEELARMDGRLPAPVTTAAPATPAAAWAAQRAEALALLARHRKSQDGARDAAALLREIIDGGGMTMSLLVEVLGYLGEIVGQDLREYTALIDAEYAFTNEQWYSAVQKYQAFFAADARGIGLQFERFRYRHALACYKAELSGDAARLAERLLATRNLDAELRKAATKLAYVARASRADAKSTADARAALASAAKRFLAASPSDPDADGARVLLAQSSGDTGEALRLLSGVKGDGAARASAASTRFHLVATRFAKEANRPGAALDSLAREGLAAWNELPADERKRAENLAFFLQLKAVADKDPAAVLAEIARADAAPEASASSRRAYFWARLRCYDRLGEPQRVREDIARLGDAAVPSWMAEALYPWVLRQADPARADYAGMLAPKLRQLPDMERRFRLLEIESLLAGERGEDAYERARALVADYPKAGDGYRMLAKSAQATRRLVEADNAWSVITDKVPPSYEVWWEGMLGRIELRAGSTRPASACELVAKVARQGAAPTPEYERRWEALRKRVSCAAS